MRHLIVYRMDLCLSPYDPVPPVAFLQHSLLSKITHRRRKALWICAAFGRVKVRFEVGAPRMLSQSRKLQGRLVRQLFRIWRYSERLIEPRLKIAMRKQIHAQQRDQIR